MIAKVWVSQLFVTESSHHRRRLQLKRKILTVGRKSGPLKLCGGEHCAVETLISNVI